MISFIRPLKIKYKSFTAFDITLVREKELIKKLRLGDMQTFSVLYKNYAPSLLGIISRIVRRAEASEDILQETFIKISRTIRQYDPNKGRLFTWMARIARNSALDHLRSKTEVNSKKNEDLEQNLQQVECRHYSSFNADAIGIKQLTRILPVAQKQIIDLIYFEGYTHSEAAERLAIPIGTIKTRLRFAIQALRKCFAVEFN